jgi:nitrile hydratase accessory protein
MTSPAPPSADSQFSAPWHAHAFALCLGLYEAGIFEWSEFSDALGAELAAASARSAPVLTDDQYYQCYIDALTQLLSTKQHLDQPQLEQMIERWRTAYLTTAHGSPVTI